MNILELCQRAAPHAEGLAPPKVGSAVSHPVHGAGIVVYAADWAWIEEYPLAEVQRKIPTLAELGVTDACPQV